MADAVFNLALSVLSLLLFPTILMLLFRRFVPVLGEAAWRGYCQILIWLVTAPVRLIRFLFREATSRRS